MLYYWETKYTTLIYRHFFIFPHNRHFFVHISPSVLGVWKYPFCKIPFQPSEDTDALFTEFPPLSHNVVRAADPSQIRKDGSRRAPDQGCRRGVEERPTLFLQLLPLVGAVWGEHRLRVFETHTHTWRCSSVPNDYLRTLRLQFPTSPDRGNGTRSVWWGTDKRSEIINYNCEDRWCALHFDWMKACDNVSAVSVPWGVEP